MKCRNTVQIATRTLLWNGVLRKMGTRPIVRTAQVGSCYAMPAYMPTTISLGGVPGALSQAGVLG